LTVESEFEVETLRHNPYDFILTDPSLSRLPLHYPEEVRASLAPYLPATPHNGLVKEFSESSARDTGWQTLPFLAELTRRIYQRVGHAPRPHGDPLPAGQTLHVGMGACRDSAMVFIEACRAMGFAARFVSGYELAPPDSEMPSMHAWAEVYLPGAGWRGFDPSRGLATAESHVVVAAARTAALAAPVTGTWRGTGVQSSMEFDICMELIGNREPS
jgi:transglutaminase-like putative cysteine protease